MKKRILTAIFFILFLTGVFGQIPEVHAEPNVQMMTITLNNHGILSIDSSTACLYEGINSAEYNKANAENLQKMVDAVSLVGGGTITIPAGKYYFAAIDKNFDKDGSTLNTAYASNRKYTYSGVMYNDMEYHVIECRNNVSIEGTASNLNEAQTYFYPVNTADHPTDMFYFAKYLESSIWTAYGSPYDTAPKDPRYLDNADFKNLVIDGSLAVNTGRYTAKGKGFYFVLFRNCDWQNVTVVNTDGTGFGMDCPINCTMYNCRAYNCGKSSDASYGASGIGIGYGYSADESITITECTATGNKRFGIFFENQTRYCHAWYSAASHKDFIVDNCYAAGNTYNFGGEYCQNVIFNNCTYDVVDHNELNYNRNFYFDGCSSDNTVMVDGHDYTLYEARYLFTDVPHSTWFWTGGWFGQCLKMHLMSGDKNTDGTLKYRLRPFDNISRAEVCQILYNYALNSSVGEDTNALLPAASFKDVDKSCWYYDAVMWAYQRGILTGGKNPDGTLTGYVYPTANITRQDLATILYRFDSWYDYEQFFADEAALTDLNDYAQIADYAKDAVVWCREKKVMNGYADTNTIKPRSNASRMEAAKMIVASIKVFDADAQNLK